MANYKGQRELFSGGWAVGCSKGHKWQFGHFLTVPQ